ncbi:MAG: hypothetical protein ACYC4U_33735 [Pirellulaceae bacterium]
MSCEDLAILETLETVDRRGIGLRMALYRVGRRVAHRLALVSGSEVHWLLASVEGDDHTTSPPSPPLQQWSLADLNDGRQAALLVGMAGRSHWSLSAESGTTQGLIQFDVACRAAAVDPPALSSVYQLLPPWQWSVNAQAAVVSVKGYSCYLRPVRGPGSDHVPAIRVERDQLTIVPQQVARAATYRWQYELSLMP